MRKIMTILQGFGCGGLLTTICANAFKMSISNGIFATICSIATLIAAIYYQSNN